ncbi:MAG: proton-conducting transporter membrane subunit [Polyangiaceae bacterium]
MSPRLASLDWIVGLAPAWPALTALLIAAWLATGRAPSERVVSSVATTGLGATLLSIVVATGRWVTSGFTPQVVDFGALSSAEDGTRLLFVFDGKSLPVALTAAVLLLATSRFSSNYLHREPGFVRFFALMLVFGAGLMLLLLGGSLDIVFAGWELVGMTSVLLVGFFHERTDPVRAAIRVLITYRLCDIGLVFAGLLLYRAMHTTEFHALAFVGAGSRWAVTLATAGIVFAIMGKSAQFPLGGWLPRAMEGPTASSAIFYGGLSVHAGVYLLVRVEPLYADVPALRLFIGAVGAVTAIVATLSGQVSPDAKTSLAYATSAQVGIMLVECAAGLPALALVHLVAHTTLRYYQFLRTPSVLQAALARRAALGAQGIEDFDRRRWRLLPTPTKLFLYRLAIERFEVEAVFDRWVGRPVLALSAGVDRFEKRLMGTPAERPTKDAPPRSGGAVRAVSWEDEAP